MTKPKLAAIGGFSALAAALFVVSSCSDTSAAGVVASAEGAQLTVDDVVALLENQPQLPANRQVIRALAELWVDYSLLATAAAGDSTLSTLDVDDLIRQRIDQDMIRALREGAIQVDTVLDDEQLRYLFEQDQPGVSIHARHILLPFDQTNAESRAAALEVANQLRQRLIAGGDFAELAAEYSQDPGTSAQGGDLGTFTRERMVAPFSDAAFALAPGEISEPVETMFGFHLIRVDSREVPDFDDVKDGYRNAVKNERIARAESIYVAGIEGPAAPRLVEGSFDIARAIGANPGASLPRRARSKAMVEYEGGTFMVREFRVFLQNQSPAYRTQVAEATDEQLETALLGLTRGKLLVERARAEGLEPDLAAIDSMRTATRADIIDAARRLGVLGGADAADPQTVIRTALAEMLRGDRDVIPLGQIGYALSEQYTSRVDDDAVGETSRRIEEARTRASVAPPTVPSPSQSRAVPVPDSAVQP